LEDVLYDGWNLSDRHLIVLAANVVMMKLLLTSVTESANDVSDSLSSPKHELPKRHFVLRVVDLMRRPSRIVQPYRLFINEHHLFQPMDVCAIGEPARLM